MSLSSIDPNIIVAIFATIGTFIWNKLSGRKTDNIADVLTGLAKQELARIVTDPTNIAFARSRLDMALHAGLERLGVKPSKAIDLAVSFAVEKAMGELADRVAKHVLPAQFEQLGAKADKVMDAFTPKGLTK
jgi:hypothetical protein